MKHILWGILLVVLVGCGETAPGSSNSHFQTMRVERQDLTQDRQFTARIESQQNIDVRPLITGIVQKICVKEGARVKKGTAQLNLEGKQKLYEQQMVGEFDLRRARHAKDEAAAQLETAQAELASARTNLDYTTICSQVDGTISILECREGNLVAPSMEFPIAVIAANKHIYAYTSLSEKILVELFAEYGCSSSEELMRKLPAVKLYTIWGEELPQQGHLDAVSGNADIATGAVLLRASFDNPSELFRNGSNGYLVLPTTKHGVIVIPQDATIRIQNKSFVYRVVEGKAVFTEVEGKLAADKQSFVVTDGLKDGDVIVIENVGLVTEGMAITQEREEKESK